jgi:hypothetical protein
VNFLCPGNFSVQTFLTACVAGLPPLILTGNTDGFIVYQNNILNVTLKVPSDANIAAVTAAAAAQGAAPV